MSHDDERDYAEEAANRRVLETPDVGFDPGAYAVFPEQLCGRCGTVLTDYLCGYWEALGLVCDPCDRTLRRLAGMLL
jgi:hypothetical protein